MEQERQAQIQQGIHSPITAKLATILDLTIQDVFGQIKACLGYKICNLRGKRQVKIDMGLVLMANNLLKYNKRTTQN